MAQLVARLVRNEKVGGSNPPSSTTGRHPIRMSVFCMPGRYCGGALLWRRWCSGRRVCFVGPCCAVGGGLPALCCLWPHGCSGRRRARPPARSPHASLKARSGRSRSPPVPSGPSGALHTSGAWSLMCGRAHCLVARLDPAAAHGHRSLALPLPTGAAGDSRETVITFAGACSVSGETDGTIASQIQLFSALFHRAKASWVSWRCPEAPALVSTVSSRGAVSCMGAKKFAQRDLSMVIARKYSPSVGNMVQNGRFVACWASFFAGVGGRGVCWANRVSPSGTLHTGGALVLCR